MPNAPYYQADGITLHLGDSLDVLPTLDDASVDAIVCDPPYGLEFMGKDWDAPWKTGNGFRRAANSADTGRDNAFGRASRTSPEYIAGVGFQHWCEQWAHECIRILKPGGHLAAFGGTRTYHRLACALEDAGFEIRDSLHWFYGSGFPKSLDVSKAIDKAGGASPHTQAAVLRQARERASMTRDQVAAAVGCTVSSVRNWEEGRAREKGRAVEFIVPSAQYREALANLLGYSADERRTVGVRADRRGDGTVIGLGHSGVQYGAASTEGAARWEGWGTALKPSHEPIVLARKPLAGTVANNVMEHGTGALNITDCRVQPTGESRPRIGEASQDRRYTAKGGTDFAALPGVRGGDPAGRWPTNVLLAHPPLLDGHGEPIGDACADGCAPGCPVAEMDAQSGVRTSGSRKEGTYGLMGYMGADAAPMPAVHGDSGGASRFFPVFRYEAKAPASERPRLPDGTAHPTVKPLALLAWLVRLLTPPGGLVLDPFAGSGTTLEAAAVEGFRAVGIERHEPYAELCRVRLAKPLETVLFGDVA